MSDFWVCVVDEFKALGLLFVTYGTKFLVGLSALCVVSVIFVLGMWTAALLSANREDDDE